MLKIALQFALLVATASSIAACGDPASVTSFRSVDAAPVVVEPLRFEPVRTRLEAVGTSRALKSVDLYPAAVGDVVAVHFEPGQPVKTGQVLVELDSREERLALELATVQLADAERLFDRYQRSSASGAVLPTVLDQAETAVATAKIALKRARIALDDRSIAAPFDGYVDITEVDPGDRIGPETLVTTLDDRGAILVSFDVPEAFVASLLPGAVVGLQTWNTREPSAVGEIVDIGSRIDPQNRTFTARARVANAEDRFRPGMSFRVTADIEGERFPVVTETGVQWGADGAYVWSVHDGRASRVVVDIVQRRAGRVLIDGNLDQGAIVVVEGLQRMREGIALDYSNSRLAADPDIRAPEQAVRSVDSD